MPLSDFIPAEAPGAAAGAILPDSDVPCVRCGYNLRGLQPEGHCPECGAAIEPSVAAEVTRRSVERERARRRCVEPLEAASPGWLLTLQRGCELCLLGVLGLATLGLPAAALLQAAASGSAAFETAAAWLLRAALLTWIGLYGVGVWLLTTPGANEANQPNGARFLARSCTVLALGGCIGIVVVKPIYLGPGMPTATFATLMPCGPFGIIAWCALAAHIARLARRARDIRLAVLAKVLAWTYGLGWGLGSCVASVLLSDAVSWTIMATLVVTAALIVVVLPYRLRQHLRTALKRMTRSHAEQRQTD